jgi:hypothetical protein
MPARASLAENLGFPEPSQPVRVAFAADLLQLQQDT